MISDPDQHLYSDLDSNMQTYLFTNSTIFYDEVSVVAVEERVSSIQARPLPSPPDDETPSKLTLRCRYLPPCFVIAGKNYT
jgi:hypothetical protein